MFKSFLIQRIKPAFLYGDVFSEVEGRWGKSFIYLVIDLPSTWDLSLLAS